ncbi:MAG: hypothetical protein MHMPM18_000560 [Marteilia pararefringens]
MGSLSKNDLINSVFRSSESKYVIEPQEIKESLQFDNSLEDFIDPYLQQNFVPLPLKSADSDSYRSFCSTSNPFESQLEYEYPPASLDNLHEWEILANNNKYNDRMNMGRKTSHSLESHCVDLYRQFNSLIDNLPACSRIKRPPTKLIDQQLHFSLFFPKRLNLGLQISQSTPILGGDLSPEISSFASTDSENSLFSTPSQISGQNEENQTTIMKSFSQIVAKKTRAPYSTQQYSILNDFFQNSDGYLRPSDIDCIMMMTGLKRKQIRKYFANKRNRNNQRSPS